MSSLTKYWIKRCWCICKREQKAQKKEFYIKKIIFVNLHSFYECCCGRVRDIRKIILAIVSCILCYCFLCIICRKLKDKIPSLFKCLQAISCYIYNMLLKICRCRVVPPGNRHNNANEGNEEEEKDQEVPEKRKNSEKADLKPKNLSKPSKTLPPPRNPEKLFRDMALSLIFRNRYIKEEIKEILKNRSYLPNQERLRWIKSDTSKHLLCCLLIQSSFFGTGERVLIVLLMIRSLRSLGILFKTNMEVNFWTNKNMCEQVKMEGLEELLQGIQGASDCDNRRRKGNKYKNNSEESEQNQSNSNGSDDGSAKVLLDPEKNGGNNRLRKRNGSIDEGSSQGSDRDMLNSENSENEVIELNLDETGIQYDYFEKIESESPEILVFTIFQKDEDWESPSPQNEEDIIGIEIRCEEKLKYGDLLESKFICKEDDWIFNWMKKSKIYFDDMVTITLTNFNFEGHREEFNSLIRSIIMLGFEKIKLKGCVLPHFEPEKCNEFNPPITELSRRSLYSMEFYECSAEDDRGYLNSWVRSLDMGEQISIFIQTKGLSLVFLDDSEEEEDKREDESQPSFTNAGILMIKVVECGLTDSQVDKLCDDLWHLDNVCIKQDGLDLSHIYEKHNNLTVL